jgi:signal transduction histidine kinase
MILLGKIADAYAEVYPDSSYQYGSKMLVLTRKLDLKLEEVYALNEIGYGQLNMGNYPRSLQSTLNAISIAEDKKSEKKLLSPKFSPIDEFTDRTLSSDHQRKAALSRTYQYAGILYLNSGNNEKSKQYYYASIPIAEEIKNYRLLSITYSTLGRTYLALKQPDSALICLKLAYDNATKVDYNRYLGSILLNIGRVYATKSEKDSALFYFKRGVAESEEHGYYRGVVASNLAIADIYKRNGQPDSSLFYIKSGLPTAYFLNAPDLLLRSYTALADFYKTKGNNDSTVKYQSLIIKINDSLFNTKQVQQFQNIDFDQQQREQEKEASEKAYRYRLRMYGLLMGLGIFLLLAIILWRNNRNKQRAYSLLIKQKQEIDFQKSKVEQTLAELRSTQAQLIQSEKMASLGELTAGIAHEIQNPLNFVNNFSEVNKELLVEMNEEIDKGNLNEAKKIAKDVEDNEEKIIFHGKRADAIVKSMLQHSRSSSGKKEPTDINALADEYLRLAYHGLRAKDKTFNATMKTDYDEGIGNINIIPQDIGRVILNLITNAFYAVDEKQKQIGDEYEPTVTVSTKKMNDKVEIKVADNGNGIPKKALDKIFQPFFTTKPTGQGTGLGLSLSYDIVKAHGGEIRVKTEESIGSEFIIILPL